MSKAFDTVNKTIMLGKLERMGFRGVINDWFESYLSDRRMMTQIPKLRLLILDFLRVL